jgi:hypothetical protein
MRYMLLIYKDEKTWGETCYNIVEAQNLDEAISSPVTRCLGRATRSRWGPSGSGRLGSRSR